MNKFHVRFHLGAGEHFKHWQVKDKVTGGVSYYNPHEHTLILHNCKLVNMVSVAKRVNETQLRDVSGWIECDSVSNVSTSMFDTFNKYQTNLIEVTYDPKVRPYWYCEATNNNLDNAIFSGIITHGRRVWVYRR